MKRLAIVILNYNTKDQLKEFIPPLYNSLASYSAEIWVADNGSKDGSLNYLADHFPAIKTIDLEKNWGFAEGYNLALSKIEAQYFLLLNSDVEADLENLWQMVEYLDNHPTVAVCQPKVLSFHKKEYFEYAGASGGMIDQWGYPFCRGRIFDFVEKDEGQYDIECPVFWASGAAFLIRSEIFKNLGGFDGSYFAHLEEIDLCWRIQRAGFLIMVIPQAKVFHVGGGTLGYQSPFKTYLNFRNSLTTLLKNKPFLAGLTNISFRLILDGFAAILFISKRQWASVGSIIKAHWH
ncbi:MAG: hypothetical protein RJA52_1448, partial [Bacteroidota bacterium]